MNFGERLRILRDTKGLTGEEFGKMVGAAKQTVSNWENNKRAPSKETMVKIAELYNTSVDYLLCNTDIRNEREVIETIKKILIEKGFTDRPEELEEIREFLAGAMDLYNLRKNKKS